MDALAEFHNNYVRQIYRLSVLLLYLLPHVLAGEGILLGSLTGSRFRAVVTKLPFRIGIVKGCECRANGVNLCLYVPSELLLHRLSERHPSFPAYRSLTLSDLFSPAHLQCSHRHVDDTAWSGLSNSPLLYIDHRPAPS
jgi:hypothetical protein